LEAVTRWRTLVAAGLLGKQLIGIPLAIDVPLLKIGGVAELAVRVNPRLIEL